MHVIRSRAREYASHATVAGVISSVLDLNLDRDVWFRTPYVPCPLRKRNRIAFMIAPALVRFARARALRSAGAASLYTISNYFKSSC